MSRLAGRFIEDSKESVSSVHKGTVLVTHEGVSMLRGVRHLPKFTHRGVSSPSRGIYGLACTISSLAILYALLRCFHVLTLGFDEGSPARWLSGGWNEPCQSERGSQEGGEAEENGLRRSLRDGGTPARPPQQERMPGVGVSNIAADIESRAAGGHQVVERDRQAEAQASGSAWREQRLSQKLRLQLVNLFMSIETSSGFCSSLLPVLRADQGLRLALKVVRVFALELGALALAPESFQHLRLRAGRALICLASVSLYYGSQDRSLEGECRELRSLAELVAGIKEASVIHLRTSARLLHIKLSTLVKASLMVVGTAVNVLVGLSQTASGSSQGLPPGLVEQQLGVLEALVEAHGNIIVRDKVVRSHISNWQRNKGVWHLLSEAQFKMRREPLPPSTCVMQSLIDAVNDAGGLLPPNSQVTTDLPALVQAPYQGGLLHEETANFWVPRASEGPRWPPRSAYLDWRPRHHLQRIQHRQAPIQDGTGFWILREVPQAAMEAEFWIEADHRAPVDASQWQPTLPPVFHQHTSPTGQLIAPTGRDVLWQPSYAAVVPYGSHNIPQDGFNAPFPLAAALCRSMAAYSGYSRQAIAASGQVFPITPPVDTFGNPVPVELAQEQFTLLAEQAHVHPEFGNPTNRSGQEQGVAPQPHRRYE